MQNVENQNTRKRRIHKRKNQENLKFGIVEVIDGCGSPLERAELQYLSANSARIRRSTQQPLPEKVIVCFLADRVRKIANIKWQKGRFASIEFDKPLTLPQPLKYNRNRTKHRNNTIAKKGSLANENLQRSVFSLLGDLGE